MTISNQSCQVSLQQRDKTFIPSEALELSLSGELFLTKKRKGSIRRSKNTSLILFTNAAKRTQDEGPDSEEKRKTKASGLKGKGDP